MAAALLGGGAHGGGGGGAARVGTARPVEDFNAMLARRDVDLVVPAVEQMEGVIDSLASEPGMLEKALECARALREGCITYREEPRWNEFLRRMKAEHGPAPRSTTGRGDAFWERIKSADLGLISNWSPNVPDVTEEDAKAFFAAAPAAASSGAGGSSAQAAMPAAATAAELDEME
jgi:hypothetical protein